MNIFYIDEDPRQCAEWMVDRHVVKMILETTQLLSTAHRVLDGKETIVEGFVDEFDIKHKKKKLWVLADGRDSILYNATHINHPSAIWVRKRESHYRWLFTLWIALMDEYTYRYGRIHASARLIGYLNKPPQNIEFGGGFDDPTPAMPDEYKVSNAIQSYRNYYNGDKKSFASWKNRGVPTWFV